MPEYILEEGQVRKLMGRMMSYLLGKADTLILILLPGDQQELQSLREMQLMLSFTYFPVDGFLFEVFRKQLQNQMLKCGSQAGTVIHTWILRLIRVIQEDVDFVVSLGYRVHTKPQASPGYRMQDCLKTSKQQKM